MVLAKKRQWRAILAGMVCLVFCAFLFPGCSTKHYRERADRQVYGIIQNVENRIFGTTNEFDRFTIDTRYSGRDPYAIMPPEIIEDRSITNRRTLTLQEALDLGAEQSRRYQTQKEQLYLTALTLTGARHEFSPQFLGSVSTGYEGQSGHDRNSFLGSAFSVGRLFKTGGEMGVSIANDLLRYYSGSPRESAVTLISANITQPILRGFGKNNSLVENLTQSERNVIYSIRAYSHFQNQFAIDIVTDYFNLLAQKNIIQNNYSNYLSQVQSTKRLEARSKDRESINAVDLARQSELSSKNNYINSIASYFNSLDAFKLELGIPLTERLFLDDAELQQLQDIGLIPAEIDSREAFQLATAHQLEILNDIDRFDDAKRKLRIAADDLKMGVEFFANTSLESDGDGTFSDFADFDLENVRYATGVELDLPLDRLRERNEYRTVLVAFEAELRELALALDSLKDNIDRGLRALEQRRQNYIIQQNALDLANRRVLSNQLLLEAGRAEVRDLVEAQNAQIDAQNSVTMALVSYQEIRLQLLQDLGVLETQTPKFWFKSHLADTPEIVATENTLRELPREELPTPSQIFNN